MTTSTTIQSALTATRNEQKDCLKSILIFDSKQLSGSFWDWTRTQRKFALAIAALFVCTLSSLAQVQYLDKNRVVQPSAEGAWFKSTSEVDMSKMYHVEVCLLSSDEVVMSGAYSDASLTTEEGYFQYYFDNGTQESEGLYVEGAKYGDWKRWDWEGTEKPDRYYPRSNSLDKMNMPLKVGNSTTSGSEALVAR